jgi:hypothetical protein
MRQIFDGSRLFDAWLFRGTDIYDLRHKEIIVVQNLPREKASRNTTLAQYPAAPLDGYTALTPWPQNGRTVETVLSMSKVSVRPQTEVVNGLACHVIDASNEKQRFTLWIDPSHGYQVAQAEYQDRNLSSSFRDVRFQKHGDVWVPMQGTVHQVWSKNGKVMSEGTIRIKRLSIDLKPDFAAAGAFVANLPNGTRVKVHDNPGLRYVWQNGRIVPDIDDSAIAAIDKTVAGLAPGGDERPTALPAVATSAIAAENRDSATMNAAQAVQGARWAWWVLAATAALALMATQWWRQWHGSAHSSLDADRRTS